MLKDYWEKTEGMCIKSRLRELRWELKYAWQRAWRGYDYTEIFNMDVRFLERIVPMLKDFKKHNVGLFSDGTRDLTEEETNTVLDEMIYHFENSDGDRLMDEMYGDRTHNIDEIKTAYKIASNHRQDGLLMFAKWFDNLWI